MLHYLMACLKTEVLLLTSIKLIKLVNYHMRDISHAFTVSIILTMCEVIYHGDNTNAYDTITHMTPKAFVSA